jgi:hypothetical protein
LSGSALRRAARRVQQKLERLYLLEPGPDVTRFVRRATRDGRETLLVHENDDELHLALILPREAASAPEALDDAYLQLVEGVSHFVHLSERARTELPTTALELELQAEVDKFVLFAFDDDGVPVDGHVPLREILYESGGFLHPEGTEMGERYRLATRLAARFAARIVARAKVGGAEELLRRFYRAGQAEKIRYATAA